ncbi:MAG: hypothetical protein AUI91_09485 [Acidobacteria bacterium 13_1_40CM_3_56_11]|nr:MAG: hypothetical protein AUI91_09485 [Acidobacteria bacterium 13_1_40CM_3_56_11]
MSKQDRQKFSILMVLLVVLGMTAVLGYRMNQPPTTAAVQVPETKTSANPPAPTDARIRLDLIEKAEGSKEEIGRKNVFQYQKPPASRPPVPGSGGSASTTPGPQQPAPPLFGLPPTTSGSSASAAPPGPPPIPLKYQGYAAESAPGGQMTAFLTDDASRHYNVTPSEILMGRYRINQISTASVEVEDLETNRRQTLPLLK